MGDFEAIILMIFFIFVFKFIQKIIDVINNRYNNKPRKDWLKYGYISTRDLHNLDPFEFERWCADFFEKCGYKIIEVTSERIDGGKDIICEVNGERVYVECKRYSPDEDAHFQVTRDIVQKLAGAMLGVKVHKGIIVTTGKITDRSHEYVKTLPEDYNIELIDGEELVYRFRKLRMEEINMNLRYQKV